MSQRERYPEPDGGSDDWASKNSHSDGSSDVYWGKKGSDSKDSREHGHASSDSDGDLKYMRRSKSDGGKEFRPDDDGYFYPEDNNGCYITTAVVDGHHPVSILDSLKQWRYDVLEQNPIGNRLSNYYRYNGAPVAMSIKGMPRASSVLRKFLVLPAVSLSTQKEGFARDAKMFSLFMVGLGVGEVVRFVNKVHG